MTPPTAPEFSELQEFKARYRTASAEEHPPRSPARIEIDLCDFLDSIDLTPCPQCHAPYISGMCLMCGYSSEETQL